MRSLDLRELGLRQINAQLNVPADEIAGSDWEIVNPMGQHAIACGIQAPVTVDIRGHVGFYCGGMNQGGDITVHGHAGVGLAENMMAGSVRVRGNASQAAGATAHGGTVIIEGDASSRCGISMKGVDIVVGGSVGHMSGFMAQLGNLVVCGDAGEALGDSIYEAQIFVRGKVESLGADCEIKEMTQSHRQTLQTLLQRASIDLDVAEFTRYGSARKLYNFDIDRVDDY